MTDKKITVGAAIIAKNESALISRMLESIKGLDEIVVVDTGSIDNTMEIARKYTDKVFNDFTWEDHYANARNHVLSKMTTDYVLSIDCDEILHDVSKVREAVALAAKQDVLCISCMLIAEDDNSPRTSFPRLFKRDPRVWWEGAIHNTLSIVGEQVGDVRITYGYSPAHNNDPHRAFRILLKEVTTRPDAIREKFYLGREYWYRSDYEDCVITLGSYVQKSRFLPEKAEAFFIMANAYYKMGDMDSARDACAQALIINATFKEAAKFMALLAGDGTGDPKFQKNANQWLKMAETAENFDVLFIRNS